jgi:alpha-N-arabinofuranosidase
MRRQLIKNPILAGFYPDPSIVRVKDVFYLVNSSFSFFPGIPIFKSTDLAKWTQIGYVLDRPEQLQCNHSMMSGGIFAPTIRYKDGIFYVISTNMSKGMQNFIVTATDPSGPWSDIHVIEGADGIDPSLFFDEDGRVYYTGTTRFEDESGNHQAIWCSQIDLNKMELIGKRQILWSGALVEAASPEGPHIYKKNGYYYLMIAEGGTEFYHAVTISRSKTVMGHYKGYAGNPILTHRHLGKKHFISNVGHGDLVELADGSWYMVVLASRLFNQENRIMGRETFIVPVDWEEDWPVVAPGRGMIDLEYPIPDSLEADEKTENIFVDFDGFDDKDLKYSWNFIGTPNKDFYKLEESCLKVKLLDTPIVPWDLDGASANPIQRLRTAQTRSNLSFVGRRQQHFQFEVVVECIVTAEPNDKWGLTVIQNDYNQLRLSCDVRNKNNAQELVHVCGIKTESKTYDEHLHVEEKNFGEWNVEICKDRKLYLKIIGDEGYYSFFAGSNLKRLTRIGNRIDGSFLGSETCGGFIGAYIGMFAYSAVEKEKYISFDSFFYKGLD